MAVSTLNFFKLEGVDLPRLIAKRRIHDQRKIKTITVEIQSRCQLFILIVALRFAVSVEEFDRAASVLMERNDWF